MAGIYIASIRQGQRLRRYWSTTAAGITSPPTFAGYRYYRMFITANNGDANYTNVIEAEFRGSVGGADLVPASPVTGILFSSQFATSGAGAAINAFNNNTGGDPWITAAGQQINCYIGYDFGVATVVRECAYATGVSSPAGRAPKDFRWEASNDGSTWTTLASDTGRGATAGAFVSYATGL